MEIVLVWVVSFVISVFSLYLVVKVFGSSDVDFKTVLAAAAIITVVGNVLPLIPYIGGIAALIINIIIVMNIMECSALMAFFTIIVWRGLTVLFLMGMGHTVGLL